jgi:hypothetical protein
VLLGDGDELDHIRLHEVFAASAVVLDGVSLCRREGGVVGAVRGGGKDESETEGDTGEKAGVGEHVGKLK